MHPSMPRNVTRVALALTLAAFLLVMSRIAIALGVRNARSAAGEFVGPTQMSSALCSTR